MLWAASVVQLGLFLLEPLSQKSGNLDQIGQEKVRKVRKSDPSLAVDTLCLVMGSHGHTLKLAEASCSIYFGTMEGFLGYAYK